MAATINNFISTLSSPAKSLKSLGAITMQRDPTGSVAVSRTTYFAEVRVEFNSRSYLLSMPLCSQGADMARRVAIALRQLRSTMVLEYRVLEDELSYISSRGVLMHEDLLLAELPAGAKPLAEMIGSLDPNTLFSSINQMQAEFTRLELVHSNLKVDNIMVDNAMRLYPIHLHYASVGGDCSEEFDALRCEICATLGIENPIATYSSAIEAPKNALYGYLSVGNPFEGMCVAESDEGYGYIGTSGEEIIAPQYLWAGDMREGRAEVETTTGMGLIDATGNYIVEPHFQIVEFEPHTTLTRAKSKDGKWVTFNFNGQIVN
ncbi:MAG: WG repeat-containing protein [Rikenellaceae bacterium]